jgi:hypothetical protein
MLRTSLLRSVLAVVAGALCVAAPVHAQKEPAAPKPDTYLCPNAAGTKAIDCFLNAVEHLYTMCRQVKSIEIIEFGYEKSEEGVNAAKSEYCVDKHKVTMTRPYQAALKEATGHRSAVDRLRALYDAWLKSLAELKWQAGESDEQYKARIAKPYETFREEATLVRTALTEDAATPKVAAKAAPAAKPASAPKAKAKPAATPVAATKSSN